MSFWFGSQIVIFFPFLNVAVSHWVLSLGVRAFVAENVTTTQTSGPTGEELSFLDSSWLFSKPSLPLARWLVSTLSWAPITESWCLPEDDLSVLVAIRLMRSLDLFCALISPSPPTPCSLLWMFFLTTGASQMSLQTQQGRWRYHIIPSSVCEQSAFLLGCPWPW